MSAIPRAGADRPGHSKRTLGDLLYADRAKVLPSEKEWVALVRSIAAGDQHALRELYARMHRLVFTLALRIAGDRATAEELTVDVFHEVWRRAAHYDAAGGTVVGWVMNLARSRAIDRLRFEQRQKRTGRCTEDPLVPTQARGADEALVEADRRRVLRDALSNLTADERLVIETAYFQGLSHSETAARLAQPLGTVKTRIRSGLVKLRLALDAGMIGS